MNPKPLWDKSVDSSRPLRKPMCMTENVPKQNVSIQPKEETNSDASEITSGSSLLQNNLNSLTRTFDNLDVKETSKPSLNPDAPEWFPSYIGVNYNSEAPKSVQNRLRLHKSQPEPQNSHNKDNEKMEISSDNLVYGDENDFEPDIKRLKQIITTLSKDPGQFDNLLDLFMETLMPYLEDFLALSVIVRILVEQVSDQFSS